MVKETIVLASNSSNKDSTFYEKLTYSWLNPLFKKGLEKPLESADLNDLEKENRAEELSKLFQNNWKKAPEKGPAEKILKAANASFGGDFYKSGAYLMVYDLIMCATPVVIRYILLWLDNPVQAAIWYPFCLIIVLFLLQIIAAFLYNYQFELAAKVGFQMRTALSQSLFTKFFKLSNAARQVYSIGKIVNISSTDCFKIDLAAQYFHMMWTSVVMIFVVFALLFAYLGIASLSGFALILLYLPFQYHISKANAIYRRKANVFTDQRMRIIQESLKGIRVIKAYNWENSFMKVIAELRKKESKFIYLFLAARATASSITQAVPTLAMVITFIIYYAMGLDLSIATVIPSLALFYALRVPMLFAPVAIAYSLDAWISFGRIGAFLDAPELDQDKLLSENVAKKQSADQDKLLQENDIIKQSATIQLIDCEFEWDVTDGDEKSFKLENINIIIPKGKLVACVGAVGAGKSSLLQALIGDMRRNKGEMVLDGTVAYCQQQPWITNSSLQANILFGKAFDSEKMKRVIKECCLERDISILHGGLGTEIGENGINLSGGQKQRLSLARACYSDPDILLFDDPLSAVDAHVGKYLFEECIKNYLKEKTRILVTHQLHFIDQVDWIILMDNSKIIGQGTYEELMKTCPPFSSLLFNYNGDVEETTFDETNNDKIKDSIESSTETKVLESKKTVEKLISREERVVGGVSGFVVRKYVVLAGGVLTLSILAFFISATNLSRLFTDQWLVWWATDKYHLSWDVDVGIYVFLAVVQMIFAIIYGFCTAYYGALASNRIHDSALRKIYSCPTLFFDQTPLGRISSRFSRDIDTLDSLLPESIRGFTYTLVMCIANLALISVFIWPFVAAILLSLGFYYILQKKYRATARELRRIDSISRSPVIAMITETLTGISTIRSFGACDRFISLNTKLLDENNRAQYLILLTQRWIQLRIDCLNSVLVLCTCLIAVLLRDMVNPGVIGLLIAYSLQVTQTFAWCIKTGTDVETFLNSAERLIYYMENIPSERPYIIESNRVKKDWPSKGGILVKNICLRYRENTPFVLNDLSFEVYPGERIAIVGRTGAGKSTVLSALLRLTEYESGSITIDDVDIQKIGLSDLRSNMSIIPQEPVLFSGTIRYNLDPFSQYTDEELWETIRKINLYQIISDMPLSLDSLVTEGGDNWSLGQRQLICLGRAVLKKSKVILLDEATASVDFETDETIQNLIRSDFCNSTVITIAHRLNTIADYDRVMVLSFGKILEFTRPTTLLDDPSSEFSKMVAETGDQNSKVIRVLSKKKQVK